MTLEKELREILKRTPGLAVILAEILSPPPSISTLPRPWET